MVPRRDGKRLERGQEDSKWWRWGDWDGRCAGSKRTTGVRRETASGYLRAAGVAVRAAGGQPAGLAAKTGHQREGCPPTLAPGGDVGRL